MKLSDGEIFSLAVSAGPVAILVVGVVILVVGWVVIIGSAVTALGQRLTSWWQARRKKRRELQQLADVLHFSNSWHCGCWVCVAERRALSGDVPRGAHVERGTFLGVPYVKEKP